MWSVFCNVFYCILISALHCLNIMEGCGEFMFIIWLTQPWLTHQFSTLIPFMLPWSLLDAVSESFKYWVNDLYLSLILGGNFSSYCRTLGSSEVYTTYQSVHSTCTKRKYKTKITNASNIFYMPKCIWLQKTKWSVKKHWYFLFKFCN